MKKIIIKNYIQGLCSYLDEQNINWKQLKNESIEIEYNNENELFLMAFNFGLFYSKIDY